MTKKVEQAVQAVSQAEQAVLTAKESLTEVIASEFPKGTTVFFKSGRGESSAPVMVTAGEFLFLDTAKGKKVHYSEVSLVPSDLSE